MKQLFIYISPNVEIVAISYKDAVFAADWLKRNKGTGSTVAKSLRPDIEDLTLNQIDHHYKIK